MPAPATCPGEEPTEEEWMTLACLLFPVPGDAGQQAAMEADVAAAKVVAAKVRLVCLECLDGLDSLVSPVPLSVGWVVHVCTRGAAFSRPFNPFVPLQLQVMAEREAERERLRQERLLEQGLEEDPLAKLGPGMDLLA